MKMKLPNHRVIGKATAMGKFNYSGLNAFFFFPDSNAFSK